MAGNSFVTIDLDEKYATDAELSAGLSSKVSTSTYNAAISTINDDINSKASSSSVYTRDVIDSSMDLKADQAAVDTALSLKADQSEVDLKANQTDVDLKANQSDVDTALNLKADQSEVDLKANQTDVDLKANQSEVDSAMALKANQSDVDTAMALKANQSDVDTAMALKANQSDVDTAMNNKQDVPGNNDSFVLTSALNDYALQSDIPTLAGGYSVDQVNYLLDLKADKNELVFRETGEVDENGNLLVYADGTPLRDTNYTLTQSEVGTKLYDMDNAIAGKQESGDYITRDEAVTGSLVGIAGAIGGGLLTLGSTVFTKTLDTGEEVTKTVGDVFDDIGDFLDTGGSGEDDGTNQLDFNSFIQKEGDWQNNDNIQSYTERKAKNTPTLESGNLQIKSSGVRIDSTTATPLTGYKFHVEGDSKFKNGTKKYLDCYNDKVGIRCDADLIDLGCDVKIEGDTCVEGDLKVTGILKNGADKGYILQEDHDQDITDITDILDDIVGAIPTDENGNNEIPDGETLAYNSQITDLQTQVDNLPTISTVDTFVETKLASLHIIEGENANDPLALKHYLKDEVDALIPDTSQFETSEQLNTRLADYTTLNLFEQHENLMELELQGKADTTAIPDVSNFITAADLPDTSSFITAADLPDTSSFITSSDLPDTSSFITDQVSSLSNYDTSSTVDGKILAAGVGSHWSRDANNHLSYDAGNVGIHRTVPRASLDVDGQIFSDWGSSGTSGFVIYNSGPYQMGLKQGNRELELYTMTPDGDGDIRFKPNDVQQMVIKDGGNVGVGTSSPESKLTIEGGNIQLNSANGAGDDGKYAMYSWNDILEINPRTTSGGYTQTCFTMTKDANIGIGFTNPACKLDVNGSVRGGYNLDTTSYFGRTAIGYCGHSGYMSIAHIDTNSQSGYALLQHGNGTTFLNSEAGSDIYFREGNADKMRLTNGKLGIGTVNPSAPLHVASSSSISLNSFAEYSTSHNSPSIWTPSSGYLPRDISIYANQHILANAFYAQSDKRIKENIVDVEDHQALDLLRQLKPKKYQYKDKVSRGSREVFGFLAQEVEEVLPECVIERTEPIPNILELADVSESNVITFNRFDTSNLVSNVSTLEVVGATGGTRRIKIVDVIDTKKIKVDTDLSDVMGSFDETGNLITETTTTTLSLEEYEALTADEQVGFTKEDDTYTKTITKNVGSKIGVYGQVVDDFLSIDKNYIWTIASSALQEVDRQLQAEKARNDTLEARLLALEEKLNLT